MARNLAYYVDPEEEERKRLAIEEAFGPPAPTPPPNLGVAPAPRIPYTDAELEEARRRADIPAPEPGPGRDVTAEYAQWAEDPENLKDIEEADPDPGAETAAPLEPHPLDILLDEPGARANPYEDLAQAPAPVDRTAASVSAEQRLTKGIDTEEELGWADDLLGEVKKRVIDKPELGSSPLTEKAADFASRSLDPREGFSKEKQGELASAAYGEDSPPSTRWEDEFNTRHGSNRLTDDQIRRRSAAIGFFTGAVTDDTSAGQRWADMQHRSNAGYDEGLSHARDRDKQNTRISRGLAAAIAQNGVPPEEAVKLTYGDPLVKNFGQYASQGGRAEGQSIGFQKAQMDLAYKLLNSAKADDRTRGLAMLQSLTQLGVAETYANKGQPNTPEAQALSQNAAAALMGQALGADPETGARALAGDVSRLSEEQKRIAARLGPQLLARASQPRGLDRALDESIRTQSNQPIKDEFSIKKSIDIARADPKYRVKFKNDWDSSAIAFREAWGAWSALPPEAQGRFSEWAAGGFTGDILKFLSTPEEQEKFAAVRGVINALVKERSGSAVTGSEWERIASEIGLEADNWGPFNSPGSVTKFLKRTGSTLEKHADNFQDEFGSWGAPRGR